MLYYIIKRYYNLKLYTVTVKFSNIEYTIKIVHKNKNKVDLMIKITIISYITIYFYYLHYQVSIVICII